MALHPDMLPIQAAQKTAYAGSTIAEQRVSWSRYAAALAAPRDPAVSVEDLTLGSVKVRVYRHAAGGVGPAAILYMHGGGFMKGDLDSSDPVAWGFCADTRATVISIDYRLTPEHRFPAAFDDCISVLRLAGRTGNPFGTDPGRIAVAGDSAGGYLAIQLALAARKSGPRLAAQAVIYPCTGSDMTAGSFVENATGWGLTTAGMEVYMRLLLGPAWQQVADPLARPALARDLGGMPPALVHVAELDPLRDEGRAYAAALAMAGVDVTYREARGMIHGFMRARFTGADAAREYAAIGAFLADRLG